MTSSTRRSSNGRRATAGYALEVELRRAAWRPLWARIAAYFRKLADQRALGAHGGLETMSDRDLRDIGLRRADVVFASGRDHPSPGELAHFERE
jgi:uncharacterized protein YjiS (DUF1127 family)